MRRLVLLLLCCVLLCSPVLAANEATSVQSQTTVRSDGSCQVTLTVTIRMETAAENLEFPLPGDASGITLNGAPVRALREGDVRMVDLRSVLGGGPWENTLTFRYTLDSAVSMDGEGRAMLEIPILCGFAFPVEQLEFSVILPGEVPFRPAFSSGYHQESIESSMTWSMDGNRLAGSVTEELLDRETLSMTLELPPELVPGVAATDENNPLFFLAALGCTVLAFLYWLIFLRSAPLRRVHRTTPPRG